MHPVYARSDDGADLQVSYIRQCSGLSCLRGTVGSADYWAAARPYIQPGSMGGGSAASRASTRKRHVFKSKGLYAALWWDARAVWIGAEIPLRLLKRAKATGLLLHCSHSLAVWEVAVQQAESRKHVVRS